MMNNYYNYNPSDYPAATDYGCGTPNYMDQASNPMQNDYMLTPTNLGDNNRLFNSYDGFIRGNMFADLYSPYTPNEPYNLVPANEREAFLNKIREYGFALVDLDLYLDTHPDDRDKINVYNQYLQLQNQAVEEYESKYGPLSLKSNALNSYPWAWEMPPWPWEVK